MQTKNKRDFPQLDKGIYRNPAANMIINGERPKASPLRSGTRQGSTLASSIQHRTGGSSRAI